MPVQDPSLSLILINLLGISGIVVWHLQGSSRPTGRLIVQILFFCGMTLIATLGGISPFRSDNPTGQDGYLLLSRSARILWWTHLAWTVIGFLHIYFRLNRRPREAHLIQDMAIAVIYLGVVLSIIGFVFGMPIGTLVATSGVVAIILGLALQNTLGDVFSGIALTLGRTCNIGDWVRLSDGTEGRVTETNWRATNLLTAAQNIVVLPNSLLAKQVVINLSRPDETYQMTLPLRIAAPNEPRLVEEVMQSVLQAATLIIQDPPPIVSMTEIDAAAIRLELLFRVESPASRIPARNEVIQLLYRHCAANGLLLAQPVWSWVAPTGQPRSVVQV